MNSIQPLTRFIFQTPKTKVMKGCRISSLFNKAAQHQHSFLKGTRSFSKGGNRIYHKLSQLYSPDEIRMMRGFFGGLAATVCLSSYFFIIRPIKDLFEVATVGDNNDRIAITTFLLSACTQKPHLLQKFLKRYLVEKEILNACVDKIINDPKSKSLVSLLALINAGACITNELFCYAIENGSMDLVKICVTRGFKVENSHIDLSIQVGNEEIINFLSKQFPNQEYIYYKLVNRNTN